MNKIIIFSVVIFVVLVLAAGVGAVYFYNLGVIHKNSINNKIACTMEAKLCADGSYVSRSGANCEFAKCPEVILSGIKGVAMLGPMCPVQRIPPDPKCADRPYKTDLTALSPNGAQTFQNFSSDENGKFSVDLPAGEYLIQSSPNGKIFSHCQSNGTIKVFSNQYTNIILNCDTGIR